MFLENSLRAVFSLSNPYSHSVFVSSLHERKLKKVGNFWTGTVFFHIPTFHAGVNLGSQVRVRNFLFRLLKMAGNLFSVFVSVFHESFGSANNHRNELNDIPSCSLFSRDSKDIEQNFKKLYQF